MKLKSLLFGSAAVLAAGTGAQAADLPVAEPVEYVRICDAFGVGFYYIPGTDTCLRISGRVRIESHYVTGDDFVTPLISAATSTTVPFANVGAIPGITGNTPGTSGQFIFVNGVFPTVYSNEEREFNNWTTRARGNVRLDARTQTDFGLVRAFIEYQLQVGPGDFGADYSATSTVLNHAYIQVTNDWGTYTAGHTSSFFDFWGSNTFGPRVGIDDSTGEQTLFGWTFGFGNGFSATVSIEDPQSSGRRQNAGVGFATFTTGALTGIPFGSVPGFDSYEGQEAPDLVGNIRVDQGWGSAQIMGVVRHLHDEENFESGFPLLIGFPAEPPLGTDESSDGDEIGFAVGGGLNLNLPFFGLGFNSQAGYSEGAIRYITSDPMQRNYFGGYAGAGDFTGPEAEDSLTEAWMVRAGITGDFTPTVGFSLDGSYTEVDTNSQAFTAPAGVVVIEGVEYNHQAVVGNVTWTPVPGLLFGWEAGWNHLEIENSAAQRFALSNFTTSEDDFDVYGTMFRVQRDF